MEWETMSSPDLVNLVNELTCTLGDQTKRKTTEVLKFQLQQMEAPKQKQNPLSLRHYCKNPGHWKKDC